MTTYHKRQVDNVIYIEPDPRAREVEGYLDYDDYRRQEKKGGRGIATALLIIVAFYFVIFIAYYGVLDGGFGRLTR